MNVLFLSLSSAALVFFVFFLVINILLKEKNKIIKRVDEIATGQKPTADITKKPKERKMLNFLSMFSGGKALVKIANELSVAAIALRPEEYLSIWFASAVVPAGLVALFGFNILVCMALFLAGIAIPPFLVHRAKMKKISLFDKQLGDALSIIGNCLRAGFSFAQAMESISREMPDPIAKEFSRVIRETKLGLPIEKALSDMVDRQKNRDLELIISAVLIQRQVGGNLSEILDNIAGTIKERLNIKNEIKVLTATGRTSGLVVGFMPVLLLVALMILNPSYVGMFFSTPQGIGMLVVSVVLETTGLIVVKRIVDIKF